MLICLSLWKISWNACQRHKGSRTMFSRAINDVTQRDRMLPREAVFMNSCNKLRVHCTSQGVSWLNLVFLKRFSPRADQQKQLCRLNTVYVRCYRKKPRVFSSFCWVRKDLLRFLLKYVTVDYLVFVLTKS